MVGLNQANRGMMAFLNLLTEILLAEKVLHQESEEECDVPRCPFVCGSVEPESDDEIGNEEPFA